MPSKTPKQFTDKFVEGLTWATALREFHDGLKVRNEERAKKGLPEKAAKEPSQVVYYCTRTAGLSLALVVGYGGKSHTVGSKTFRAIIYRDGKPVSVKLGSFPQMKVEDAWTAAEKFFLTGKSEKETKGETFKEVAERYIKNHVERKKLISQAEIARCLDKYLYPAWRDRTFTEIRRGDINVLLDQIAAENGPVMADALLAIIRGICNWYRVQVEDYVSPLVPGMSRSESKPRERILDDEEIKAVWDLADSYGTFGRLLKFALLTGMRRTKLAELRWEDIKDGVWTVKREAREKGTPAKIVLPELALQLIKDQPRIDGNPHVFAISAKGPFTSWDQPKKKIDIALRKQLPKMPDWTIHDLRRTARSLLSRADVRFDVGERVLGHAIEGVAGTYDRHDYAAQIEDALKRLAALLQLIVNPPDDNVVQLNRHSGTVTEQVVA